MQYIYIYIHNCKFCPVLLIFKHGSEYEITKSYTAKKFKITMYVTFEGTTDPVSSISGWMGTKTSQLNLDFAAKGWHSLSQFFIFFIKIKHFSYFS